MVRGIFLIERGDWMPKEEYMRLAIELAKKGEGHANPNPMVGAVIVKNDTVIGQGYHRKYGTLHAERNAIASLTESARGATIYVTLEPCCHYGKTPPCTEAIVEQGIAKVVIGSRDPNPLVSGKGVEYLREHGIEVVEDFLREECDSINPVFFHYIRNKTPYVVMKYAMTMDGKIACHTGASKWVTGEQARAYVQELRNRYMGIMVGANTVFVDDPMLNCRMEGGRNPIRIVCDSHLKIPVNSRLVQTAGDIPVIIATTCKEPERQKPYRDAGCEIIVVSEYHGRVCLKELMHRLGERNIDSILLEGGGTLNWSALEEGIVNHVMGFVAPKFFGGYPATTPVEGNGVEDPSQAVLLKNLAYKAIGEDLLIEGDIG